MVICLKKEKQCSVQELEAGDCWIGLSLASSSGLILAARVGKHTDTFIAQLVMNTEGKTECKQFNTDSWGGYERVLPLQVQHHIGKDRTQRLERTNGIVRQQTGRWHRRQNKARQAVGRCIIGGGIQRFVMQCPECSSTHIRKNGSKKGKQRYICADCQRQFLSVYEQQIGYSNEFKRECLELYLNGMGASSN